MRSGIAALALAVSAAAGVAIGATACASGQHVAASSSLARNQYEQALNRLDRLPAFHIHEKARYFGDTADALYFDVSFKRPGTLHGSWYINSSGLRLGGKSTFSGVSTSRLRVLVSNLLVPEHAADYLFGNQGYELQSLRFEVKSTAGRSVRRGHRTRMIIIRARGFPWLCPPSRTCAASSPEQIRSGYSFTSTLILDGATGLPRSFISTGLRDHYVSQGQTVTFTYR